MRRRLLLGGVHAPGCMHGPSTYVCMYCWAEAWCSTRRVPEPGRRLLGSREGERLDEMTSRAAIETCPKRTLERETEQDNYI